jgi:hypothetical protein
MLYPAQNGCSAAPGLLLFAAVAFVLLRLRRSTG